MFNSQSLSSNGPLGAVWLAAYRHKRLKKLQVTQTDIPSSVDKMLLGELDVIAYRVLAYFLIGIVRIYSKKVEYLFKDCHKVLIEIKGFVLKEPNGSHTKHRTGRKSESCGSVSIPERFELDTFDLEVVEEECSRDINKPLEEITLRDHIWSDSGTGQFFSGLVRYFVGNAKTREIAAENLRKLDRIHLEHQWQDLTACCHPSSPGCFPSEDVLPSEMAVDEVGRICDVMVDGVGGICDMVDDQVDRIPDQDDKEMSIETLRDCSPNQGEDSYLSTLDPFKEGFLNPKPLNKDEKVNGDKTGDMEGLLMEEEKSMENVEPESSVSQKARNFHEEREDDMLFDGAEEEPLELVNSPGKGPVVKNFEMDKSPELVSMSEKGIPFVTSPLQLLVDQAAGTTNLETIPTPKVKEHVLKKRKRSCLCDDTIVLSNKELRRNIADTSGLVCKRKMVPHNFFAAWKASRTRNDSILFSEPVISGMSPDLTSLFYVHVIKTPEIQEDTCQEKETQEDVGGFEKSNILESPGDGGPSVEPKGGLAPDTPARHPSSRRPSESPVVSNYDATRDESNENEPELDFPSNNEEITPCDGDDQELNGTTEQTRMVVKFLQRMFVKLKKGGEDEVVSLFKVSKGKTCRYCARLFYEILVLKSKGCVGVEQELPYDDIMIRKCPELEHTFGI